MGFLSSGAKFWSSFRSISYRSLSFLAASLYYTRSSLLSTDQQRAISFTTSVTLADGFLLKISFLFSLPNIIYAEAGFLSTLPFLREARVRSFSVSGTEFSRSDPNSSCSSNWSEASSCKLFSFERSENFSSSSSGFAFYGLFPAFMLFF